MDVTNKKFHFLGELTIQRSHILNKDSSPYDDKVNWLFLMYNQHQYSFVYSIENPLEAQYNRPFIIKLSFTMETEVIDTLELNYSYKVLRGPELIGEVTLLEYT